MRDLFRGGLQQGHIVLTPKVTGETSQKKYEALLSSAIQKSTARPPQAAQNGIAPIFAKKAGVRLETYPRPYRKPLRERKREMKN